MIYLNNDQINQVVQEVRKSEYKVSYYQVIDNLKGAK